MIGIEWDVPSSLTSPAGTLNFNVFPGLTLVPKSCQATKDLRVPKTPVPQGDGDIIHRRFQTGYVYKIVAQAWDAQDVPSCKDAARVMFEALGLHLHAMLNTPGRYCWTPTNYGGTRALDQARWFSGVVQDFAAPGGIAQVTFEIDSPFPYVIDLAQTTPTIVGSGAITNNGNTDFYPVIQVQGNGGPGFSVISDTLLQGLVYDASRPGAIPIPGGSYADIDTYNGTIFMNGNGADLSAGIDPVLTNLENPFVLVPGVNFIEANGANATFLVNNSWA